MHTIDVAAFVRKIYRLMDTRPEIFKVKDLGNGTAGHCMDDGSEIAVHYKHDLLSTLIHEVVHYYYPGWSERKVLRTEKYIINNITARQATNILKRFTQTL